MEYEEAKSRVHRSPSLASVPVWLPGLGLAASSVQEDAPWGAATKPSGCHELVIK